MDGIASNKNGNYNNAPQENDPLEEMYKRGVESGWISPLCGLSNYKNQYELLLEKVVGQKTSNGIEIQCISEHFMQRLIGTSLDPSRVDNGLYIITGTNPQGFRSNARSGADVDGVLQALTGGFVRKEKKPEAGSRV